MGKIVLVFGGARSGKSSFAEKYVAEAGKQVGYIATAQIYDDEMAFRVKLHRERRPENWQTYEAPFDADKALLEAGKTREAILFDCLTVYLSNILCSMESIEDSDKNYAKVRAEIAKLLAAARKIPAVTVFVANEVGCGIVPDNHLSREYRDLAGLVNQIVAAEADEVYGVFCGLPIEMKKLSVNLGG